MDNIELQTKQLMKEAGPVKPSFYVERHNGSKGQFFLAYGVNTGHHNGTFYFGNSTHNVIPLGEARDPKMLRVHALYTIGVNIVSYGAEQEELSFELGTVNQHGQIMESAYHNSIEQVPRLLAMGYSGIDGIKRSFPSSGKFINYDPDIFPFLGNGNGNGKHVNVHASYLQSLLQKLHLPSGEHVNGHASEYAKLRAEEKTLIQKLFSIQGKKLIPYQILSDYSHGQYHTDNTVLYFPSEKKLTIMVVDGFRSLQYSGGTTIQSTSGYKTLEDIAKDSTDGRLTQIFEQVFKEEKAVLYELDGAPWIRIVTLTYGQYRSLLGPTNTLEENILMAAVSGPEGLKKLAKLTKPQSHIFQQDPRIIGHRPESLEKALHQNGPGEYAIVVQHVIIGGTEEGIQLESDKRKHRFEVVLGADSTMEHLDGTAFVRPFLTPKSVELLELPTKLEQGYHQRRDAISVYPTTLQALTN